MINLNKHKYYMMHILKDIYSDSELFDCLGFKGGTALMFFHDLPRYSVDLDFNLLDVNKEKVVYEKMKVLLTKYGVLEDEALKFFGPVFVLNYGQYERKLKVEISNRQYEGNYEIRNLLGIDMKVLVKPDMFAHKLCALLERNEMTGRDVFDCWFFLDKQTPINIDIVEKRMGMPLLDYLQCCINAVGKISDKTIMNGLGELTEGDIKKFCKTKLRLDTIALLRIFRAFPLIN